VRIAEVVNAKGHDVALVHPATSVAAAAQILRSRHIGALVVSEDGATIKGILSERDIVYALAEDRSSLDAAVSNVMTTRVFTVRPEESIVQAMAIMTRQRCRHLPVLKEGRLDGIVSIGDLVKARVNELEMESRVLRDVVIANH
jgi:CBS domain-containing protein